ncbi:hypothetical protein Bca52824_001234 [Brassica carinata]|uniref:Uncharacterized protein n=1 Tax=Brassica carinata TaxID=52824 RepID=A0A8X8B9L1_BRACI|nr:hypothetical protein Bca52824_001234 [Brassica carinata]
MTSIPETPTSKAKDAASTALFIGRNTIIIREPSARDSPKSNTQANKEKDNNSTRPGRVVESERREDILPSHGIFEVGEDGLLNEEQANMITMTAAEEAEGDKLASEFDGVMMDENMMKNDDLLVDEPGYGAEQIDAISQLSPMIIQEDNNGEGSDTEQQPANMEKTQGPKELERNIIVLQQKRMEYPAGSQLPARGLMKRKPSSDSEVKGTQASKKLQLHKGWSPKKIKGAERK